MIAIVPDIFSSSNYCFYCIYLLALDRSRCIDAKMVAAPVILPALIHIHAGVVVTVQQVALLTHALIPAWEVNTLSSNTRTGSTFINILAEVTYQAVARVAVARVLTREVEAVTMRTTRLSSTLIYVMTPSSSLLISFWTGAGVASRGVNTLSHTTGRI